MKLALDEETFEEINNYNLIYENTNNSNNLDNKGNNLEATSNELMSSDIDIDSNENVNIISEENNIITKENVEECTALVELKERRLFVAQAMFKKSIKVSIKSFLISLSLSFLNLFI